MANQAWMEAYQNRFANVDAFGRGRVSLPNSQFDYQNQYNSGPLVWYEKIAGGATSTHLPNEASVQMAVAASGDSIIRQSAQYYRYHPGKSQTVLITGVLGAPQDNIDRRIGYFDSANGVFFELSGSTMSAVVRTKASGTVVNNKTAQSDWNVDKMDGSGPSGLVLDPAKTNIFFIDLEWLGVGRVRFCLNINGNTFVCHESYHANLLTSVYMATANLPLRYELAATGTTTGATMKAICATVLSEGDGDLESYYSHVASNGITPVSVTTRRAILSVRPKATFNSITNRSLIYLEKMDITAATNNGYWELVYGGTLGGTPSWTSCGTESVAERDVSGTTVTGGEILDCGYVLAGSGSQRLGSGTLKTIRYPLVLDIDGLNPKNLSLVVTSFTGTCSATGAMVLKEIY
jgi:hypothetical protein